METNKSNIGTSPLSIQNDNAQAATDKARVMAAIFQESEAWLELPWVQEKLKARWDGIYNLDYPPFEL